MSEKDERGLTPLGRWPFGDLERWEPFGPSRFGGLLNELLGERALAPSRAFAPAVDVAENDDEYIVTAELPGATKDDVTVELHEGVLTIRGEKKSEREEKKEHSRWVERRYGSFSRAFTLPANADGDHMKATFKDGVLSVHVPKTEAAKPRAIRIQS